MAKARIAAPGNRLSKTPNEHPLVVNIVEASGHLACHQPGSSQNRFARLAQSTFILAGATNQNTAATMQANANHAMVPTPSRTVSTGSQAITLTGRRYASVTVQKFHQPMRVKMT
jgi:hypothetical protein